ncbi:MAG: TonB-dependent receptor [Bacteroidales bacterium]|nr:TonB-dependent receptor [Bacteroidales bacterium]
MKKQILLTIMFTGIFAVTWPQQSDKGSIQGRVFNAATNEPVPFATLVIWGTTIGSVSDLDGNFLFTGLKPGYVRISASSVGFESYLSEEFLVSNANRANIEIPLNEMQVAIDAVVVKASVFRKKEESPVSLRRIGIEQIEKNPGGNRDISKVIQSFPGVSSTPAYRNDVIVRGGGPGENAFYLDGVEIPNLNHFATQGASGGPVGIINTDFIREVNFYSGAFPANLSNAMSSVLDMRQVDGNNKKLKFKGSVGASDLALTFDGPLTPKTTFIASARRSYLQFLFSVLELPFLPTYNDFQFKTRTRLDEKNEITIVGLGALDQFNLNLKANQTLDQRYILSYLPVNEQWNYTFGVVYKHFGKNGYDTYVLSRNFLNNSSYKYPDNNEALPRIFDYLSTEGEDKFRYERNSQLPAQVRLMYGMGLNYSSYYNRTETSVFRQSETTVFNYESELNLLHYNAFAQISRPFLDNRLSTSFGLRADGNTYSSEMANPLGHLSPRFSLSYNLTGQLALNFNTGRYHQRPPYTAMGYKNATGELVNKTNGLTYISSDHLVAGIEYSPSQKTLVTVEGFYKNYTNYPYSVADSVPLSTKGADFGTYGDEELKPISDGRAYGFEVLGRSQDFYGFNTVLSYTYVRSEFEDLRPGRENKFIPTSWDNRHLLNITATRTFKANWYAGFRWRFVGGAPYTPWDIEKSEIKAAFDVKGAPFIDYSNFNTLRLKPFHQLDVRIDKEFFFDKWSLNLYADVQNIYNFKSQEPNKLVREKFIDPEINDIYTDNGVDKYRLVEIVSSGSGTILPTVGIIVEF